MIRLHVLGTSAAMPSAERSHVGFVVQAGGSYLLECGPTIPWQIERAGLDHRSIGEVFVSHVHGDHSLGLPILLTAGELDRRDWPLRVYCPASAVERIKTICRSCYPSQDRLIEEQVEWVGLSETEPTERLLAGGAYLRSAPGKHGVPDLAYRLDYGGRSVVYSGDTAPAPSVVDLARGADLLLHDATWSESIDQSRSKDHSSCRQAGRIASSAAVRRLGLVHLHKRYRGREAELVAEASAQFGGEVLIPSDGDELEV